MREKLYILVIFLILPIIKGQNGEDDQRSGIDRSTCKIPSHFRGDYFSMERRNDIETTINDRLIDMREKDESEGTDEVKWKTKFWGHCVDIWNSNETDANGNHDSRILLFNGTDKCYQCFDMLYKTPNVIQYRTTNCNKYPNKPSLEEGCKDLSDTSTVNTFFRKTLVVVNCKNTFEGTFHFTYEMDIGGGGICNSQNSLIKACQEPGSRYKDNQIFYMNFGKCEDVATSRSEKVEFQCLGTWTDDRGNIWSAVAELAKEPWRERFRCMMTRFDQQEMMNRFRYSMSWWADCSQLKSPYDGPIRLKLEPVAGVGRPIEPSCNLPRNFTGNWFYQSEQDVDVTINTTHIYFKTKLDQYTYKESYFICRMTSGNRYLMQAITVGKCEVDYICFEFLPRHHSIIRWRMGRPYRLTEMERADPKHREKIFRLACTWSSFTIDREDVNWMYNTFLLNPPVPILCPIRGRYKFKQIGIENEKYRTRYRGITERPRHSIPCDNYVSEFKSCDDNANKIAIDAEYCETVDHIGMPIGEYDEPDRELTCVGHWDENWQSYLITYDEEDPVSFFRCWNYERTDWRFVKISRSTGARCRPEMISSSSDPKVGASLHLLLEENERLFDDCPQAYIDGDPWSSPAQAKEKLYNVNKGAPLKPMSYLFTIIIAIAKFL